MPQSSTPQSHAPHTRNRRTLAAISALALAFVLAGCSAVVTEDQVPGTYKAEADWGTATVVFQKNHDFHQTVTPKNGPPRDLTGHWILSAHPGNTPYTTISLSPFFNVTHDKQGAYTLASAYSIYHVPFGGINIASDPDYGIAYRK